MITLTVPVNFYEVRLGRLEEATRRAPKKLDDAKGALSDKRGWITVGELKRLLDLLGLDYESVEKDIIAMGSPIGGVEIVNPRFPPSTWRRRAGPGWSRPLWGAEEACGSTVTVW